MRTLSAFVAVASLFLTVALVPVIGGALLALLAIGVFFLALTGVLAAGDRTVEQHDHIVDPKGWRNGS